MPCDAISARSVDARAALAFHARQMRLWFSAEESCFTMQAETTHTKIDKNAIEEMNEPAWAMARVATHDRAAHRSKPFETPADGGWGGSLKFDLRSS